MFSRRRLIKQLLTHSGIVVGGSAMLTHTATVLANEQTPVDSVQSASAVALASALAKTPLVYLTPFKTDGGFSRCQAEVWFVAHEGDLLVVTATDAWRAQAINKGLTRTKVWVGDVGVWDNADGAYLQLPDLDVTGTIESKPAVHATVLKVFGAKYSDEWGTWGPRFRDGLADGSRVLLRYKLA